MSMMIEITVKLVSAALAPYVAWYLLCAYFRWASDRANTRACLRVKWSPFVRNKMIELGRK